MPRRKKTVTPEPENHPVAAEATTPSDPTEDDTPVALPIAAAAEAEAEPGPFAARRTRAVAQVQTLLDRFAQHRFTLDYPSIRADAAALVLLAYAVEQRTCPHCAEALGPRIDREESEARWMEYQYAILRRDFQARCTQSPAPVPQTPDGITPRIAATLRSVDALPRRLLTPRSGGTASAQPQPALTRRQQKLRARHLRRAG